MTIVATLFPSPPSKSLFFSIIVQGWFVLGPNQVLEYAHYTRIRSEMKVFRYHAQFSPYQKPPVCCGVFNFTLDFLSIFHLCLAHQRCTKPLNTDF